MRRVAAIAGFVLVILLIGAAAIPYLASGDFLKARIAGQIAAWTGRSVTISGNPTLSFYPYLAVTVDGLVIGNGSDAGSTEDALVAADLLRATLRPLPLLLGRAEFEEFELIRPRIRLVMAKDGSGNWRMGDSEIAKQAAVAEEPADTALMRNAVTAPNGVLVPRDVQIGRLRITDGIVLFDDLASEGREELTDVDVDIAWPSAAASAGGSGHVTWRGKPVEFNASVARPLTLIGGGSTPFRFALASTVARIAFSGTASAADGLAFDGDTTVTTPSLRDSMAWMGTDMGTGPILGAAAVRGVAHVSRTGVTFDAATLELDGNTAAGTIALTFEGRQPSITAHVTTPHLDLTPYQEAARADLLSREPWLLAPAQLPFTHGIDANLTLGAEQVIVGTLRIADVAVRATTGGGALDVSLDGAKVYGGTLAGTLKASSTEGVLSAAAHVTTASVPAGVALMALAGVNAIDGRTTASFDVEASGKSWGEFIRAATGSGKFNAKSGTLRGFDLVMLAGQMSDPFAEVDAGDTETAFYDLSARFSLSDGNIVTDDLSMTGSGYLLKLAGRGSVVTGLVDATALLSTGETEAPIAISGHWNDPGVVRDLERPRPGATLTPAPTGG